MSTPPKSALRKAAKGAVMAGTAALAAVAVGTLVKRRLDGPPQNPADSPRLAGRENMPFDPLPRKESE
jgi:hypothetical protein